jgi:hypothetical protein
MEPPLGDKGKGCIENCRLLVTSFHFIASLRSEHSLRKYMKAAGPGQPIRGLSMFCKAARPKAVFLHAPFT